MAKAQGRLRSALRFAWNRPRLTFSMANQLRFSPFLVQMVVTRRCNLACGYCNEYTSTGEPVPLEELKRRIDAAYELGSLAIEFTGGEPLLHPQIADVVRYATKRGFVARMMISNAYLFTEKKVRELNEAGLTDLQISIDGVKPNEITVKVLNPLREKLRMVSRLGRFRVQLSGVIGAGPPEEVLEMIDFAKEQGFLPRVLLVHDGSGQLTLNREERAAYEEAKSKLGRRFSESKGYRERLLETGEAPFRCRAGARYLYVDEFGLVHWCSQQRKHFEKPLLEYTLEDLKRQFYLYKDCNTRCTVGCARTCSAHDEWRKQPER